MLPRNHPSDWRKYFRDGKKANFILMMNLKRLSKNSYQDGSELLADKDMNDIK